ncbi:MAG: tetratricopeptide repeat protein [Verrucomicrobia bacterium]|nr:tetratricopeptide repeat protein [Verrucomicrobiota bacterium]
MRVILLILAGLLLFGLTSTTAQQPAGDAGDQYYKGYLVFTQAERLEQANDIPGAIQKLQEAQQMITGVARTFPAWQPEVVSYRLKMIEQTLQRLAGKGGQPAIGTIPPIQPSVITPTQSSQAGGANPGDIINQQFQALQKQNADLQKQINDLLTQRKIYEDGYTNSIREKEKVEQDRNLLARQKADLDAQIEKLSKDTSGSMAELTKLRNEAKMVSEMVSLRDQQLSEKDKTIAALQSQNKTSLSRQKDLEIELEGLKRDTSKPEEVKNILAENARLKVELSAAREQVDALKATGEKKDEEIAALKSQVAGIQDDLVKLRQENTAYQTQVADLTLKLKEVNARMEKTPAGKSMVNAKLVEENRMLHDIIMRELRHQERQRQAKELVIAEMKKMENASQTLMDNLEEMTSARIKIAADEENLFSAPELKQLVASMGVRATIMAENDTEKNGKSKTDAASSKEKALKPDQKLLRDAVNAADKGDFKTAEQLYQDALRANPKSTTALISLAVIKQQQKKYDDARVLLQKCIAIEPDNDQANYRLGVGYFQKGMLEEAQASFEKSVAKSNDNARAHHYLGIISGRLGNRHRAESEFKQSLAIDPKYGDAHFNLAVLYATSSPPDWDLARKHYQNALDHGVKTDAALEKLLKKSETAAPADAKKEKSSTAAR